MKLILAGLLKVMIRLNIRKPFMKRLNKIITKNLFFNIFLESTVEGIFGLMICGYLNIKTL